MSGVQKPATTAADEMSDVERPATTAADEMSDVERPATTVADEMSGVQKPATTAADEISDVERPATTAADEMSDVERPATTAADEMSDVERPATTAAADMSDVAGEMSDVKKPASTENYEISQEVTDLDGVPIDHGWSWVICFSVFIITLLQFGHDQAIFVLFVDFVEEFQQPASVMTSMFTIFSLTSALSSLVTSNVLMPRYSSRQITCAAAILGSTLTLLLSRSPNVLWVLVIFGLKGTCFGALLVCPTSMLGFYFNRRRSFATGVSNTGLCAAFIIFPPLTQILREEYGLRGTLLILSALELHIVVVGMFLRPVETYRKFHRARVKGLLVMAADDYLTCEVPPYGHDTSPTSRPRPPDVLLQSDRDDDDQDAAQENQLLLTYKENGPCNKSMPTRQHEDCDTEVLQESLLHDCANAKGHNGRFSIYRNQSASATTQHKEITKCEEHSFSDSGGKGFQKRLKRWILHKKAWEGDIEFGCECFQSSEEKQSELELSLERTKASKDKKDTATKGTNLRKTLSTLFDTSLLEIWPFRMILLANGLGTFTSYVNIYMPTVAVKAGLTEGQAVSLLTMVGALDLCSRVGLGCLADTGLVAKTKIVSVCLACISVLCHLNRFYTSYIHYLVYAACVGLTCGCRHNLLNVILIDHVGVDRLAKGLGLCSLLNTALLAANHLTIGLLLDATGSFVVPLHFVGAVVLVGSLLYLAEPIFLRLEMAKETKRRRSST